MSLHELAEAAGVAPRWKDVHGAWHDVSEDSLRYVIAALGLPASTDADIADSLHMVRQPGRLPPLITGDANGSIHLPVASGRYEIMLEDGSTVTGETRDEGGAAFELPGQPGYHRLRIAGEEVTLAVAPTQGWLVSDAMAGAGGGRPWGLAVQLYSLRRAGDGGLGDFGGLSRFVRTAALAGASAVAISPVHAQFAATPGRFSPYSPSSRTLLNVLHAELELDTGPAQQLEAAPLVDWHAASRLRLAKLAQLFDAAPGTQLWHEFENFRAAEGASLEGHARFEALHGHVMLQGGPWHWREWPGGLADAASPAVQAFAAEHSREVARHAFYQFMADRSLAVAQRTARECGMPIGLISDLAVGVDSGGSQCWAWPDQTLLGLAVGAPPDLLNTQGQDWGLAAFSPRGLQNNGYRVYIDMLRAAMRHAGGVRIDHAMGLARLWMVPTGTKPAEGAYLHFPVDDMLRLIRLESLRNHSVVLGEDLGTLPEGFQGRISRAGILGMRVLWFERAQDQGFTAPATWDHGAVAMTSTHDLATVAGWWSGHDTAWRHKVGAIEDAGIPGELAERERDRQLLWSTMQASGSATGPAPPSDQPSSAVDAAVQHVGGAACDLAIIPMEDMLGLEDQPNLPGTLDEHPNWCRRLPGMADELLTAPAVATRLRGLQAVRSRSGE